MPDPSFVINHLGAAAGCCSRGGLQSCANTWTDFFACAFSRDASLTESDISAAGNAFEAWSPRSRLLPPLLLAVAKAQPQDHAFIRASRA